MEQPSLVECIAASFHGTSASRRGADTSGSCDFHGLTKLRPTRCGWVKLVIEGAEVHGSDVGSSESALPLALPTHSLPSKVLLCCVVNLLQPGPFLDATTEGMQRNSGACARSLLSGERKRNSGEWVEES